MEILSSLLGGKENLAMLIQVVLAVTAIWYATETRWYRKGNESHLDLLERQILSANTPYVLLERIEWASKKLSVINHSNSIAREIHAALYDPDRDMWSYSLGGITPLKIDESNMLVLDSGDRRLMSVLDYFTAWSHQQIHISLSLFLRQRPTLIIFFKNLAGHSFMNVIEFIKDDSGRLIPSRPVLILLKKKHEVITRGLVSRYRFWLQRNYDIHQAKRLEINRKN